MDIWKNASRPSKKGPADWFAGSVRIDAVYDAQAPARASSAQVTFEPGARTAWHTHPLGQTLIIVSGVCWAQSWDGEKQAFHPGDVVRFAPGEKHWHGASSTNAMTHIAIHEALDGKTVDWLEHVTDEHYGAS
jgi:quercetin dioxygenase-like cupin family protein